MRRIPVFLAGLLVGAGMMFVGLKYHVVRAGDGFHWIPKSAATIGDTYVDIREFTADDWNQHRALGLAILQSDEAHLLQDAAAHTVQQAVQDAIDGFLPNTSSE